MCLVSALSAYSPAVFALNDMLRQQLSLTRHFVQANRYLHSSLLQTLEPADYAYTTLEGTKEVGPAHTGRRSSTLVLRGPLFRVF